MLRKDFVITTKEVQEPHGNKTIYVLSNLYSSSAEDFPAKIKLKEGQPITDEQISQGLFVFNVTVFTLSKTIIHQHTYKLFASEITLPDEVPRELQAIFGTSMVGEGSITYIPNPVTWSLPAIRVFCELEDIIMPPERNHQADINKLLYLKTGKSPSSKPTTSINLDTVQLFLEESVQIRASLKAELTDITVAPSLTETPGDNESGSLDKVREEARVARRRILKQYNRLIYDGTAFLKPFRQWLHPVFLDKNCFVPLQIIVYKYLISKVIQEQGDHSEQDCIVALRSKMLSLNLQLDEEAEMEVEAQLSGFVLFVRLSAELATLYLNTSIVSDLVDLSNEESPKKSRPLEIAICICKPFTKAWLKLAKYHRRVGNISKSLSVISSCVSLLETYDHEQNALKRKVLLEHRSIIQQLSETAPPPLSLPREEVTPA
ncbi:hypothetical protein GL50803_0024097 [Giardia duodenalis]|uniref:Uncharacterized protein n=1 Tax=Giardia intestinalis (strain ATCC 50803 / WB clone C6) TaxID=184922 RepID=D3KHQ6_GIAIC|nr:hypothetical protein GL50803_0024097 [Giardia intestinalis]KAE8304365.1 hypothetical protein GL50803_0024097 [Giardia intestinalis]